MKILQLSSEQSWRGGEQQIAYLIEELQKSGVKSQVAVRKNSAFESWCHQKNIPFVSLPFRNELDLATARGIKNYCAAEKFDLLHLHSSRSHGLAVLSVLMGNKTPMVLSRRVDFPLKTNPFSRWKYNHNSLRKIICVSKKIEEIISTSVSRPDRCITVYDGIDLNRFAGRGSRQKIREEFQIAPDEKLVGNIAAIAPHKDYFTFLETAKLLLKTEKVKFLITGDGPLKNEIKHRIAEENLTDHVFLTGFRNDLENIFASLDVLLYTSKEEGLGSTLLDAMAFGLPIVTTEAGGIPEIVRNRVNGLTAAVGDAQELSLHVSRMLHDNELRQRIVDEAKRFVPEFSKEKMAQRTLKVYQTLLPAGR